MIEERKKTILFVDDEESILEIASEYFQHKGYDVITAVNGVEALEVLDKETVDCCFTDINMPEMDGMELAENIRLKDNTLPVVVMTGYPSLDNTIRTLKNGVVDFLIKPVNLNQMELCVKRVLRERNLFVENLLLKKEVEGKERLENLNRELLYKVDELHTMNQIMTEFSSIRTSQDVFRRVVNLAIEITPAERTGFYVVNEELGKPYEVVYALKGVGGNLEKPKPAAGLDNLIMEIFSDEIPLLISDNNGTKGVSEEISSIMLCPLKIREKTFGVITAVIKSGSARFSEKDLYYFSFMANKAAYGIENLALYENIYENLISTLYAFVAAIEAKDEYTQQHSHRVAEISVKIAEVYGCSREELEVLNFAGRLHDIGKIGIRDEVLLKPGRLTREEFEEIKTHPVVGASIVGKLGLWSQEEKIIRHHHERFDGSGYPDGLKGEDIPLLARIMSVADAYDAMASDRAYRKKMSDDVIIKILKESSGSQFDPEFADIFLTLLDKGAI